MATLTYSPLLSQPTSDLFWARIVLVTFDVMITLTLIIDFRLWEHVHRRGVLEVQDEDDHGSSMQHSAMNDSDKGPSLIVDAVQGFVDVIRFLILDSFYHRLVSLASLILNGLVPRLSQASVLGDLGIPTEIVIQPYVLRAPEVYRGILYGRPPDI
ncbi:uncharacterized protein ARMOST_18490 [Armillaria ostoyae]|uniref:DUF1746 domain-containing protein n=1 Tax=Armillaria ostoyae TaxID=47428 RepID=A0A284S1Z0_ARMOS|nr:uncharacterized protein ARMOST_18490 [Armillaria ostoyae]